MADEIMPIDLALIVYYLVSVLTFIDKEIVPVFSIDSLLVCVLVDIDS